MPLVSIILITYNRAELLRKSIQSAIEQTFRDFEIIVVDDCSTDNTEKAVSAFKDDRIRYIKLEKNSGGCLIPRTIGLAASGGKYVAVLDDDDSWSDRRKLELQVSHLNNNPDCVLVGTDAIATSGNSKVIARFHYPRSDSDIRDKILLQNCFFHSSVMYRAETISAIGGYIQQTRGVYSNYANDYDLWLRMGKVGKLANLPIDGVRCFYSNRTLRVRDQAILLTDRLQLIHEYRSYYPHYLTATLFVLVVALFEMTTLSLVKERLSLFKNQIRSRKNE